MILYFLIFYSYEKPPPGLFKENDEEKPEDVIPDLPENKAAREFLAKAPTKGLWMPLGKEVKVMKCWRCKIYGHRSGDKECPLFMSGNRAMEEFRHAHEDPMYNYIKENEFREKMKKVEMLKTLLQQSDDDDDDDNDKHGKKRKKKQSTSSSSSLKKKKEKKDSRRNKHRRKKLSSSSSSSDSDSPSLSSSSSSSSSSSDDHHSKRHKKKRKKEHSKKHRKHHTSKKR
ncbi:retinitis pigmentosa 9 protein homolog isoform X2 [Dermatophagoides farinae]|uniref:retinitis pigmentosa 9 protein homolog isoform X2 n=1 Tax=Dermatophagoides farinae TaxID=6954 RepID=UPI003F6482A4